MIGPGVSKGSGIVLDLFNNVRLHQRTPEDAVHHDRQTLREPGSEDHSRGRPFQTIHGRRLYTEIENKNSTVWLYML